MDRLSRKFLRARKIPGTACSGCGLGQVHKRILLAVEGLGLGKDDLVWGTGIGCAGRQTFNTWLGDNFAGTHGRVYALAAGLRVALPRERRIVLTVGDGDAFGIGLKHLLNCARRNLDLTVIVADNLGFQSTGGQYGPTTPPGAVTDSSPYGLDEAGWLGPDLDILEILRAAGATFLARHLSLDGQGSVESVKAAILNPGFSLVHFIYPCVTHFGAVSLAERDKGRVLAWFREAFGDGPGEPGGGAGEGPGPRVGTGFLKFGRGVFHSAPGSRPDYSEQVKDWTRKMAGGQGGGLATGNTP
ncbi:MAG: 2-oxoglutarate ferredoxin oxidoreductase subunit beta [Deltaproteobacteria bacterium]|jgi:2-oxoglutarate ferredoxin oxidoreductase subunit beta|nr:2-oxoglutarate ferredoxin oxidoreductase subunit beta [Deltaproteobacteria bacterium]